MEKEDDNVIKCPNCGFELDFDLFKCEQGAEIMCDNCEEMIKLNFTGDTPADIKKKIEKTIKDAFRGNKYIKIK